MLRSRAALTLLFALVCTLTWSADVADPPRLAVDPAGPGSTVAVEVAGEDGTIRRHILRHASAKVTPGPTGWDPTGAAGFVTWDEAGEPWHAFSRDRGRTWSSARRLDPTLRLRDGAVSPGAAMPSAPAHLTLPGDGRTFVVQFRTVSLPEWRAMLVSAGAEILGYLPHHAHLVRIAGDVPASLDALRGARVVQRVEPFHPWYRLSGEVRGWLEDTADDAPERLRLRIVGYAWGDAGKAAIARAARDLGAEIVANWPSGHVVEVLADRDQVTALATRDDVAWIDPWTEPGHDMDLVRQDAGTDWLETNHGWCGEGVRAEVLDSGFQLDHPDFDGIMTHGQTDVDSHGTSTYGIVFGNGARDGDGDPKGTGHMPCAEQGIAADYGFLGDRFAHTQELKADPYFASFQTNSWGGGRTLSYTSESHEIDDIIWRLDIAILQSQSNAGDQMSRPQAWGKNIISVGGIRHYDTLDTADDAWSGGASIGPAADGRIKPDISYWYDSIYTTTTGSGYTSGFGGTSGATPESAGVLGLMLQMWAENVWETDPEGVTVFDKQPTFSTLKGLLINNANQYPFSGSGADLARYKQGWGRPSVQVAYERALTSFIVDQDLILEVGQIAAFGVDVPALESELKITMVYPDPPGTLSASLHRINDLDLRVTSPSGTEYHGNHGLLDGNESVPGGSPNGIDTVENVFVVSPEPGIWTVAVEAVEINQDAYLATGEVDASFSLVVTGGTGSLCDSPLADFTATPDPARVGQEVTFDSTVSGGAGGPYNYRWDFDGDGVTDSTDVDPVHVFTRPYDGVVKLRVRDAENCPETVDHLIEVAGPDLRYDGYTDLTEVSGNGNGAVDPGEIWDLRVRLRNDGGEPAIGVRADLRLEQAQTPGTVLLLQDHSTFADVAVGGSVAGDALYRFQVGSDFDCGEDVVMTVTAIATDDPVNTYPEEIGAVHVLVGGAGPQVPMWSDGFETATGWSSSGGGEWQRGAPQGLGGGFGAPGFETMPDPTTAYEGGAVFGNDLTGIGSAEGRYENDVVSTYTSPAIDASNAVEVEMSFVRWLNVYPSDVAYLEISPDGSAWTRLWEATEGVVEQAWSLQSFDVAAVADRAPALRVRFGLQTDNVGNNTGWNVDALEFIAVTRESCEPFASLEPGSARNLRVDPAGPDAVQLTWDPDCGAGTAYGIYRGDLDAGYGSAAPVAGQCDATGTSATVTTGAGNEFYLVVPNVAGQEGSYGGATAGDRNPPAGACYPQGAIDACAP